MVSFDLTFRSMLIKEIVEDEGSLWTEGSISWISINIGSSQDKRVQVVYGAFITCVSAGLLPDGLKEPARSLVDFFIF